MRTKPRLPFCWIVGSLLLLTSTLQLVVNADESTVSEKKLAEQLLQRAGIKRGVCAVLQRDGLVAVELARQSEMLIHVRDPRWKEVDALRDAAENAELGISRLIVEQGSLNRLPYATNTIDVLIVTQATNGLLKQLPANEVLRVLRPHGTAIVGKAIQSQGPDVNAERLKQWVADTAAENTKSHLDDMGTWVQFDKPAMAGADDWSHWEKGPDNNPVSRDQVIRAPYMTQFMAKPYYIGMPSVTTASDGRTFLAIGHIAHHRREWNMLNKLVVRNGYNGTILWERKFPEGYLVHRSAFIATPDTFYMIDGDSCLMLDPQTGKEQGRIHVPGAKGEWKWMAMKDNVLYVMSGKPSPLVQTTKGDRTFGGWSWADLSRGYYGKSGDYRREDIPWGFGDTIVAYDMEAKRALWLHKEEHLIDSRSLAMVDDKLFLLCPGKHLRCVDRNTGKEIWTNQDRKVSDLIKQPGERLTSTPGFKTQTVVVATPKALIIQGQTRQNVVAVSTEDGYLLWTKRKFTNNPNAIFVDGKVILGVGKGGTHVVIDPVSGKEEENLGFRKTACTRLTAVGDSFFCRGEGTLRYDRKTKKVLVDGAQRPGCNDGALPANGLLYLGPWQCDCNLSLIGCIAKCSAGDFRFDLAAEDRLYLAVDDLKLVKPLEISKNDWPTYRGNNHRSSSSPVAVSAKSARKWQATPKLNVTPTAPISAGGLVFVAGDDGKVRAIDSASGDLRWQFATAGPIKFPPSISEGRAYFGSADGHAYCVEAATGRLLWRFRAAPVERHIMVYDHLSSTWPVASGVLVDDGVAYFAAGIIDQDGTYVYAVEATSGKLIWQNNSSGHLNPELRKGVSVQGNLSILGNQLLLAGGNQVCPAQFDLKTGKCLSTHKGPGRPVANNGSFVGVFQGTSTIVGGRTLYSAADNVSTKGSFAAFSKKAAFRFNYGGIPPAWNDDVTTFVNFKHGKLTCCETDKVSQRIETGLGDAPANDRRRRWQNLATALQQDKAIRWQTDLNQPNKFEAISLVVCRNAIVAVVRYQQRNRAHPQWYLAAFDNTNGNPLFQRELRSDPLPGGLLVDRSGQMVVTMLNGDLVCFGE